MRIKVVDMYSNGDIECRVEFSRIFNDCWMRVSKYNLLEAAGMDKYGSDEEVKKLFGMEFDCTPIISEIIPSCAKLVPVEQHRWTIREVACEDCGVCCECGDRYQPVQNGISS